MPVYLSAFWTGRTAYLAIRNRAERLEPAPDGSGYRCDWRWTSALHAPKVIPALGRTLLRRAIADHPIELRQALPTGKSSLPEVTFLIGHRGTARIPHLLATLRSIAAQRGAEVECVVVEQDEVSRLASHLPAWVRLVHAPTPASNMPYCRSWSFNIGARHARAKVMILHDNDILVPLDYAAHVLARIAQGYDVVNPKRFVFYLSQAHTGAFFDGQAGLLASAPDVIVQNLEAGGSVAITRAGFDRIGGMDESFVGWGGEDNEFWERAQTLRTWLWGGMPVVHLWHPAQSGKHDAECHTARRYKRLAAIQPHDRIQRLRGLPSGQMDGPNGWPAAPAPRDEPA